MGTLVLLLANSVAHAVAGTRPSQRLPPTTKLEYIDANPCGRVKASKADERTPVILDNDQYDRLLDACGEQDMLRLYVLVLAETGCRSLSEALKLTWDDVDLDRFNSSARLSNLKCSAHA